MKSENRRTFTLLLGIAAVACQTFLCAGTLSAQDYSYGDIPLDEATYRQYLVSLPDLGAIPSSYDARNDGIVTSPKNQGSCGSCWAFASVGGMESHILRKYGGSPLDLSEQQLNSCNLSMSGCCGGSLTAPQYWQTNGPIEESCFPYADLGTSCPTQRTSACSAAAGCVQLGYRVSGWHTVSSSQFRESLYEEGPNYWRYDVYSDFSTYWNSGSPGDVYVNAPGTTRRGGHAVLLIGWDDAKGAYLCKNSWGATGGPNNDGTFWIAYTGHANNLGFQMSNYDLINPCFDFTLNGSVFSSGDAVVINEFRLVNTTGVVTAFELKAWLGIPGLGAVPILNLGADGSFILPAGFDQVLGPLPLFVVDPGFPLGS